VEVQTGALSTPRSLLIKPQRSTISPFCAELTSITPEMVAQGMLFNEACSLLRRDYGALDLIWISWGKDDRRMFEEQCRSFKVTYPFSTQHIDLRRLFAVRQRQVGLLAALESIGLNYEGTAHRGIDDAYNTARLLAALIQRDGPEILDS
jgi:inhibitor of KinA sporulation pathway (predicted exonuclease)